MAARYSEHQDLVLEQKEFCVRLGGRGLLGPGTSEMMFKTSQALGEPSS